MEVGLRRAGSLVEGGAILTKYGLLSPTALTVALVITEPVLFYTWIWRMTAKSGWEGLLLHPIHGEHLQLCFGKNCRFMTSGEFPDVLGEGSQRLESTLCIQLCTVQVHFKGQIPSTAITNKFLKKLKCCQTSSIKLWNSCTERTYIIN